MKVYEAICKVQAELAKEGISKVRKNAAQGYAFRGIDDVYNALAPILAEHGLCILPRMISRHCEERINSKGNALFYVTVEAEFDLVAAEDGSKHTIRTYGEAMDSGDKATNKAMSAAYKYAAMQAFAIPTEGEKDEDGDKDTERGKDTEEKSYIDKDKTSIQPKNKLPVSVFADHKSAIEAAATLEDLQHAFADAYKAAQHMGDKAAVDEFTKIKDALKKKLTPTKEAA